MAETPETEADIAYRIAEERIANALAEGLPFLSLDRFFRASHGVEWDGDERLAALPALPPEISDLTALQRLNCSSTQVSDLSPLAGLAAMQSLDCTFTQVSDLSPMAGRTAMQRLDCSFTKVSDLSPLAGLTALQSLDCSHTQVSDLSPLAGLTAMQSLYCYSTQVSDLSPLAGLVKLEKVAIHFNQIDNGLSFFRGVSEGVKVEAWKASVNGLPDALFSQDHSENCLPRIKAHLADLGEDPAPFRDIKLAILGNGRIGKTQIVNRLRGEDFEAEADSTHGVSLLPAPVPGGQGVFNVWDFGGQDIYHGVHALFLRGRAVFGLVWVPDEIEREIEAKGRKADDLEDRRRPVVWWLDFIKRFGDDQSPVVVIQNQTDIAPDRGQHPALADRIGDMHWVKSAAYSAAKDDGRHSLNAALTEAAAKFNPPLIGRSRLAVIERLAAMREADAKRATNDKRHRLIDMDEFERMCAEAGGVSDAILFLEFLHNGGHVFWREGFFGNRIVLDQAWLLDGVYAVFNRERCLNALRARGGRFTRGELADLVWAEEGRTADEQEMFLEFMTQCGIAFVYRPGDDYRPTEYIAPDLLPAEWDAAERAEHWGDGDPDAQRELTYDALPPALIRNFIGQVGGRSGVRGRYWRAGFYGYDHKLRARAVVEATPDADDGVGGRITLSARGAGAEPLLDALTWTLREEEARLGAKGVEEGAEDAPARRVEAEKGEAEARAPVAFDHEPREGLSYFVSYAWGDASDPSRADIVDDLCAEAEARGVAIHRDRDDMRIGDKITRFMDAIARGDRVFTILSDKYLKSPFCMYELYEIYMNARGKDDEFNARIRPFIHKDADIYSISGRAGYAIHWRTEKQKIDALVREHGNGILGEMDLLAHSRMQKFETHIGDMLTFIADRLNARSFEDLAESGFGE